MIPIKNQLQEKKNDTRFNTHCSDLSKLNTNFCSYLAGLIEGDGTIFVPKTERSLKGKLNYPSIQICFDSRDLALALILQKTLGFGSISKTKGVNAYRLTINNFEGLITLVQILNGKFRTVKINDFKLLIDFLNSSSKNHNQNLNLNYMDLDMTPLNTNAWLSGFIDADGSFFVGINKNSIHCSFTLVQAMEDKKGNNKKQIMSNLAQFLNLPLKLVNKRYCSGQDQYAVKSNILESNLILSDYLNHYPLFSSKYLNFKDYFRVLMLIKNQEHKTDSGKALIYSIKQNMNNMRTLFVWDHLQDFYNLYK